MAACSGFGLRWGWAKDGKEEGRVVPEGKVEDFYVGSVVGDD